MDACTKFGEHATNLTFWFLFVNPQLVVVFTIYCTQTSCYNYGMVIIAILVALFLIFFLLHRHSGPAHLAMISGLTVYSMFGAGFTIWLSQVFTWLSPELAGQLFYIALIALFPLIIYLRSSRGGMYGVLRVAEAALFALLMTALLIPAVEFFVPFDDFSNQLAVAIQNAEGALIAIGVAAAYIDILFLGIQHGD